MNDLDDDFEKIRAGADLLALYHPEVLRRSRAPLRAGSLPGALSGRAANEVCGDVAEVDVLLRDGLLSEVRHRVEGCSVCAGAADLMAEWAAGRTPEEAAAGGDSLGGLPELEGARAFPSRRKCAELPWLALRAALAGAARE